MITHSGDDKNKMKQPSKSARMIEEIIPLHHFYRISCVMDYVSYITDIGFLFQKFPEQQGGVLTLISSYHIINNNKGHLIRTIFAKIWLVNLKIVSPRHLSDIKNDKPATFLLLNFLFGGGF